MKRSRPVGRLLCVLVAGVTGLEPATSGLTGQRSNQLSYTPEWVTPPEADSERDSTEQRGRCP